MGSFEQAFSQVERAAVSTAKSAADLGKLAKALEKAAKEGNITAIKRAQTNLRHAAEALRQEAANSVAAWPFKDEEEEQYLSDHYWVVLLDEIELVGSYSLLQRARSYAELARWLGQAEGEEYPGLVVVGTVTDDFEAAVLGNLGKQDLNNAPKVCKAATTLSQLPEPKPVCESFSIIRFLWRSRPKKT